MLPEIFFIDSYSLMFVLGIALSFVIFELFFRKKLKVTNAKLFYLEFALLIAVIGGVIGSYLFQNIYNLIENPESYHWTWSLTFYGGIIGGAGTFFIVYFVYSKKHYPEGLSKLFVVAPCSISLGHCLGRLGCFLAGCCYGIPTEKWYGIKFPETTEKVIPTNLFECIFLLILGLVLAYLAFKKNSRYCFVVYLLSYGVWRFVIEFYRGDHRGTLIPGISPSQFWSIILVVLSIIYLALLLRKKPSTK